MGLRLSSTGWTYIHGRGHVAVVQNPHECEDFSHIVHHTVEIDGNSYYITAVESFAHAPPWKRGEGLGLVIQGKPKP